MARGSEHSGPAQSTAAPGRAVAAAHQPIAQQLCGRLPPLPRRPPACAAATACADSLAAAQPGASLPACLNQLSCVLNGMQWDTYCVPVQQRVVYTWKKLMRHTLSLDLTFQDPKHLRPSGTSLLHQDKRASDILDVAFLMRKANLQSIASQQYAPTPYCRPDVPIHRMCRSARADKSWEQVASSSVHGRCRLR